MIQESEVPQPKNQQTQSSHQLVDKNPYIKNVFSALGLGVLEIFLFVIAFLIDPTFPIYVSVFLSWVIIPIFWVLIIVNIYYGYHGWKGATKESYALGKFISIINLTVGGLAALWVIIALLFIF